MKSRLNLTKGKKRQQKQLKAKKAPKGGTLAGNTQRVKTSKKYGKKSAKNKQVKIRIKK